MLFNLVRNRLLNNRLNHLINFTYRMSSQLIKVQLKPGIIVGQQKTLPNGNFYQSFQGIPYAVPPLGELRFKSPLPLERFGVPELNCLKERNVSHQRHPLTAEVIGSEDCLYLNVYVPKNSENFFKPLPVMVWIHGGGFWFGSGNSDYYLPLSLIQEDVIVVTLNYRLGALGFLSLPEEGIWGNAGLKDQRLALQWVQDNIQAFNGDPNNVTLFGESAGASSVHLHVVAKHANKLFHKAIMQSGTANMEWVFQSNPAYKTRRLAELMNLKTSDTKELLNFLQSPKVTPEDILAKTLPIMTSDERRRCLPFLFKPVIEDSQSPDSFINRPILERLQQPNSIYVPSIMGYNSAEGLVMMVNAIKKIGEYDKDLHRFVPRNIPLDPQDNETKEIAKKMRDFYFNGKLIKPELFNNFTDLLSDYHFVVDMQKAAEWQANLQPQAPLYFYRFEYDGDRNMYKRLFQLNKLAGVCHADELFYLFQMADDDMPISERDQKLIKQFCNLWANFAKYANPTPREQPRLINCDWLPVKKTDNAQFSLDYLAIDNDGCQMKTNPDQARMEFWKSIYKSYKATDLSRLSSKL
ncbi:acetylcholinesterase [Lucilia cuprina]|uniref:acetylcholinesterase n=1 Tax=Lucilia cuprina TaxID=7375 RepID=UPI001F06D649|nr:acetylcholinesterase [Lucilia cuprina]